MSGVLVTFLVLAVELDGGLIALADRRITLGNDVCHPAVLSLGEIGADGCSATLEKSALPTWTHDAWWINRPAIVLECTTADETIYDGTPRFDGIIAAQPDEAGGIWSLSVVAPARRVRAVPDYGLVTATDWPLAADSAMGAALPMVVGVVDRCPLLPVQVQPWTTLTAPALPDTNQLEVADASNLAASGSVVVDGSAYAYTHKSNNLLLGMAITRRHAAGTLVAQAGSNIYLAAGHAVSAIEDLRAGTGADAVRLDGGTVDLAAATVTYAAPPAVVAATTRYTLDEHFDAIAAGNTCSNAANAIRAALNSYTQSGTPSGTVTAAAAGSITFARPADGNRIISGAYSVQFSVAVGVQVGWARVRIGNDIVWSYDPGVGVLYNWSPCAITLDDDADVLPVAVEVAEGGSTNQVTVTVITASRAVITGNLDEANYATIAPGQALKVTQSDTPPDRGRIVRARLVVRWFATDAAMGTTAVKFGGATLGKLALTPNSGASINKTVSVNSVTQGAASLPQTPINTAVTKTDSVVSAAVNSSIAYAAALTAPSSGGSRAYTKLFPLDASLALPQGVVAGTYTFVVGLNQPSLNTGGTAYFVPTKIEVGGVLQEFSNNPTQLTFSVAISANQQALRVRHGSQWNWPGWPTDYIDAAVMPTITFISGNVNITPTAAAVSVSGASQPIAAASLANAGISVSLADNQIQMTVPAPPRVVDTAFDLPSYTEWAQFAAKTAEITLTGTGASVCVVETYLQIEFDEIAYAPADTLTATVTGLDGNPASVIALLADASDETLDVAARVRLYDWCAANSLEFARRLAEPTDARTLLQYAADQSGVLLARQADRLAPVRWMDLAGHITVITDADLMEPARLGWADRVENAITLRYAEDYAGDSGFARVTQATASNTPACRRSVADLLATLPVEIDGGWLRTTAAASVALGQHVARHARPRRVAALDLPFGFELEQGSLIDYAESVWRVTDVSSDHGWLAVQAEQVLA